MKNAIITEKAIIPFETIFTIVKIEGKWKLTLKAPIRHGNMPDSITEEQRQEYINWLENKDKQFIHEDDYGNTDYDPLEQFKDIDFKGKTGEECAKGLEIDLTNNTEFEIKAYNTEFEKGAIDRKIEKVVKEYIKEYDTEPTHIKIKKEILIDYAIELESFQLSMFLHSEKWEQYIKNNNLKIKTNNIYLTIEPLEEDNENDFIVYDCNALEEEPISTIDFIKHMVDNYEVKCEVSIFPLNNRRIRIYFKDIVREKECFYALLLDKNYQIKRLKLAKNFMNNTKGYFKERE